MHDFVDGEETRNKIMILFLVVTFFSVTLTSQTSGWVYCG